jgi:hypothetical protein
MLATCLDGILFRPILVNRARAVAIGVVAKVAAGLAPRDRGTHDALSMAGLAGVPIRHAAHVSGILATIGAKAK